MKPTRAIFTISLILIATDVYAAPKIYAPWECGTKFTITQGNRSDYSHKAGNKDEYAWDAGLPIGTTVVAPAAGTITHVKDDSNTTCSSSCSYANYVAMKFDEGDAATFYHLSYGSALVKVGEHVERGQPLAKSGNTGWSTGPHLHFHVMQACGSYWCQSIETPWVEVGRVPVKYDVITSQNCFYSSHCEPSAEICDGKDNDCNGQVDENEVCENIKGTDVNYQAANFDPQNTDVNGDGKADVCARGNAGVYCALSNGDGFDAYKLMLPELSDANGWDDVSNYASIVFGDINGDKKADICARSNTQQLCWLSDGNSFGNRISGPAMPDEDFKYANQYTTHRLADINGDGKVDVCARFIDGFKCFPSTGNDFGSALNISDMSDTASDKIWKSEKHYATIRVADVTGDGKADVCGRTTNGFVCYPSTGSAFGSPISGPAWSDAAGWTDAMYYTTIRMPDINGDGKADVCARDSRGIVCFVSNGNGFDGEIRGPEWADSSGWNDYDNYSTIQYADINGDGKDDVCGRANSNFICYLSNGNGFGAKYVINDFSDEKGWSKAYHFRSIRLADINGDGAADVCGRNANGVICYTFNGSGFNGPVAGPSWADENGWNLVRYNTTFRLGGPKGIPCTSRTEICDGIDNNCNGEIDEGNVCCIPSEEVCDGVDNNCNGEIDEGLDCNQTPECIPSEEICNGKDDNCNGEADENGVCATDPDPNDSDIDDSKDDNGNGSEEDGNSDGNITQNPNTDVDQNGECIPREEYCNGKDDNCDGQIDENNVCDASDLDPFGGLPGGILEEDCSCRSTRSTPNTPWGALVACILALFSALILRKREN